MCLYFHKIETDQEIDQLPMLLYGFLGFFDNQILIQRIGAYNDAIVTMEVIVWS